VNSAVAGQWTLVAGGYDAAARMLRVWVNGVQKAEVDAPAWPSNGPVRIGNRKYTSTSYLDNLYGSVAQVQVFNRILVEDDFTGQLASVERSGGVNEPGVLQPVEVGHWDFEVAAPCYDTSIADTCEAPDGDAWGRRLALTQGTWIEGANHGLGAEFDNRHWVDDPSDPNYQKLTEERGTSQRTSRLRGNRSNGRTLRCCVLTSPSLCRCGHRPSISRTGTRQSYLSAELSAHG